MFEKISEKIFDVQTIDISFIELQVESQMLMLGRNRDCTNGGNFISLIRVVVQRCLSFRCPTPAQIGNEQKAAFIEENQVGTKFFGFFLSEAICNASIFGLLPHPFAKLGSLAFDNSIPKPSLFSRHDKDDNLLEIAFLLPQQFFSESKGLLSNQFLVVLSTIFSLAVASVFLITELADQ